MDLSSVKSSHGARIESKCFVEIKKVKKIFHKLSSEEQQDPGDSGEHCGPWAA